MSSRRLVTLGLVASVVAVPASLPALAQSGSAADVTHRQSVLTELSPTGEVRSSRVFTQLTVAGDGEVEVVLPGQSTRGLRNLDGFGKPRVEGDQVVHRLAASPEGAAARTVADNTADLPVTVEVGYTLDGEPIEPDDLVGRTGEVTVSYTVRNHTAEPTEVRYFDGRQRSLTETVDVSVPMVGSLSTTLDGRFVDVAAPGASVAGDGRGSTVVQWSLLLFSPLGSEEQTVSYTAHVTDAVVPDAVAQVLPVDSRSFASLRSTAESYKGAVESTRTLTVNGVLIDGNVQLLADGAAQLLDGLQQLGDGADQLAAGLADTAVPGARRLADGTGTARGGSRELANGLNELDAGAGTLAAGLGTAEQGAGDLRRGLGELADGAGELSGGLSQARGGAGTLGDGLDAIAAGSGQLKAGAIGLAEGAATLHARTGDLVAGSQQLQGGASNLLQGLGQLRAQLNAPSGLPKAMAGVDELRAGVAKADAGIGSTATPDSLLQGLARLDGGLGDLAQALPQLDDGAARLDAGAVRIAGGLDNPACDPTRPQDPANPCGIKQGAGRLAAGAGQLSGELVTARDTLEAILPLLEDPRASQAVQGVIAGIGAPDRTGTALNGLAQLAAGAGGIADGADALVAGIRDPQAAGTLRDGIAQIRGGVAALEAGIGDPATADTLRNGVARLMVGLDNPAAFQSGPGANPTCTGTAAQGRQPCGLRQALRLVDGGLDELGTGLGSALQGVNQGLGSTSDDPSRNPTLLGGANALANGTASLAAGAAQLRREGTAPLADGAGQLAAGVGELDTGANAAAGGGRDLRAGLGQLDDGGRRLAAGAGTAASGSGSLVDGLGQLADGGRQLAGGAGRAAGGANQLADGLVQLDDGANQLADGLGDAGDGAGQLAEGLGAAADGGQQVADGTVQLSEAGMQKLIEGVSDASAGSSLLYNTIKAIDARGADGEGLLYGTVDGATASGVYQFQIAGAGDDDGDGSLPRKLTVALGAFGVAGALGFGVRRRLV
ncbi:hypothetical protein [Egicoccus halophilus]|uniref:Uncharacterized protein n=1 Tax=Egicoccus halophilus TaxID=1670830 RepID=A0A8J3A560_9ACTN|nr:hypothetical protein [Egicoccus halophilus]GGI03230.1 hypothetical protein GCM10011354_03060 [Egicoccus halophilus]